MFKTILLIISVLFLYRDIEAQAPAPILTPEQECQQFISEINTTSSTLGRTLGLSIAANRKKVGMSMWQISMMQKSLKAKSKGATNLECKNQSDLAMKTIKSQMKNMSSCGMANKYTASGQVAQLKQIGMEANSIIADCDQMYPNKTTQTLERDECIKGKVDVLRTRFDEIKQNSMASIQNLQSGSCLDDAFLNAAQMVADAEKKFDQCNTPAVPIA